jgi:hypothetical protein
MAQLNFDATNIKPIGNRDAIPPDWYSVFISASENKPTKANDGSWYLANEYTIMGGDYDGYKLYDNLNLGNKNPVATEIGYRKLSAICHAVGVIQVADSAQLHNRPFMIKVGLRPAVLAANSPDSKDHDASNDVNGYKAVEGAGATLVATPPPPPAPVAPVFAAPVAPVFAAPVAPVFAAPVAPVFAAPVAPVFAAPVAPVFAAPVAPVFAVSAAAPTAAAPTATPPWLVKP